MHDSTIDRRRFLVAAIAFTASAPGLRAARVWAQAGGEAAASARTTLAQMARTLYPHAIADAVYAEIIEAALVAAAADASLAIALREAEAALDAGQSARFVELDEDAQVRALNAVEGNDFFAVVQAAVRTRVYNHPAVWALLGYEGPSYQFGGYLNRGAGEIDWLPEER